MSLVSLWNNPPSYSDTYNSHSSTLILLVPLSCITFISKVSIPFHSTLHIPHSSFFFLLQVDNNPISIYPVLFYSVFILYLSYLILSCPVLSYPTYPSIYPFTCYSSYMSSLPVSLRLDWTVPGLYLDCT